MLYGHISQIFTKLTQFSNVPTMFIYSLLRERKKERKKERKRKTIGGKGGKLGDLIVMFKSFNNCKGTVQNLVDCIIVLL